MKHILKVHIQGPRFSPSAMAHINCVWYIFFVVAAISLLLGIFGLVLLLREQVRKPSDMMLAHLTLCNMLIVMMYIALVSTFLFGGKLNLIRDILLAIYVPHVLTLVIITIDRVIAVQFVFRYRIIVTNTKLKGVLAFVWLLGAIYGSILYFVRISILVPLCLSAVVVFFFAVSYIFIIVKVCRSKKAISTTGKSIGQGRINYWVPLTIITTYTLLVVATDISVMIVKEPTPWHYIAWCSNAIVDTLTYVFGSTQIRSRIRRTRGILSFIPNLMQLSRKPNKVKERGMMQMAVIKQSQEDNEC